MRKFILTPERFEGSISFGYDAMGYLIYFNNEIADEKVIEWVKNHLPLNLAELGWVQSKIKAQIVEVPEDLSFERFWEVYDMKINRKRCEPLYNKFSDMDKLKAITASTPYQKYRASKKQAIANPQTYLEDRYFDTDWYRVK